MRRRRIAVPLCALALALCASGALAQARAVPDPATTPGAIDPAVSQARIGETICRPGWTRSVRPPRHLTERLKWRQLAELGVADADPRRFEEDHLVPLELGGAPTDPRNLWPQPRWGEWNAGRKDRLGAVLHRRVCRGALSLREAQRAFLAPADWRRSFCRYVGGFPCARGDRGNHYAGWPSRYHRISIVGRVAAPAIERAGAAVAARSLPAQSRWPGGRPCGGR